MNLRGIFHSAGGGAIPGIVQATQEFESQRIQGADFLQQAQASFGGNALEVSVDNTLENVV